MVFRCLEFIDELTRIVPHPIETHCRPSSGSFPTISSIICLLLISRQYLAFEGIYRSIQVAFLNNPTRWQRLVVRQGPSVTGLSPSLAPPSRVLRLGPPLRTLLHTTTWMSRAAESHGGLILVRSSLLRESVLVSFYTKGILFHSFENQPHKKLAGWVVEHFTLFKTFCGTV